MNKNYIIIGIVLLMLVAPIMAKSLDLVSAKQLTKLDTLDKNVIVKSDGMYFKGLKQTSPIVWIDKYKIDKEGNRIYHVDSLKDFDKKKNESVTLEFYYDTQPDSIKHITHSGKLDRYYFPTQWTWRNNCTNEICSGGWVTIEVQNIEKGTGSSTFPISTTGPTWAYSGDFSGGFNGESSYVDTNFGDVSVNFTGCAWAYVKNDQTGRILQRTTGARPYISYTQTNNKFLMSVYNGTSFFKTYTQSVSLNTWYHICGSYVNDTNVSIYLNGIYEDSMKLNGSVHSTSGDWFIGATSALLSYFNGSIDEVLIYNRSLSTTEISDLYNNYTLTTLGPILTGSIPNTTGLVLNINFDDFSVADQSGSENHGVNTNVNFEEISEDTRTLSGTDYTLYPFLGIFELLNQDFDKTEIDFSYDYLDLIVAYGSGIFDMIFKPRSLYDQDVWAENQTNTKGVFNITNNGTLPGMVKVRYNKSQTGWGMQCTSDNAGSYADFDGVNDYITVLGVPLDNNSGYTISFWVKINGAQDTFDTLVWGGVFAGVRISSGTSMQFAVFNNSETFRSIIFSNTLTDGVWNYVVAKYDIVSDTMTTYVDGTYDNAISNVGGLSPSHFNGAVSFDRIGGRSSLDRMFNGSIDEVMIFNRSLSALEVQNIYNLGRGLQEYNSNGLVAYYNFDQRNSTTVFDLAGSNDGTINGATFNFSKKSSPTGHWLNITNTSQVIYPSLGVNESTQVWCRIDLNKPTSSWNSQVLFNITNYI